MMPLAVTKGETSGDVFIQSGSRKKTASFLVLLGFTITGIIEHTISNIGRSSPNTSTSLLQLQNPYENGTRRYCDPPNMTLLYDSSEEEDTHVNIDASSLINKNFQVNLTVLDQTEFLRGRRMAWGMLFSYAPATLAMLKIGPKKVFGYAVILLLISSLYCSLTQPRVSEAVPYVFGFFIGALIPCFFQLSVDWFTIKRRSSFLSLLSGKYLGFAICDLLINRIGLGNHILYIHLAVTIVTFIWYIFWSMTVFDPLRKKLKDTKKNGTALSTKTNWPLRKMLSSRPMWMSMGAIFGAFCGEVATKKIMLAYLKHIYYLSGDLQVISFILHFVFAICSGCIVDYLLKTQFVSVTSSKRMVVYVSHFIPAGFLFIMGFVGCEVTAPVLLYWIAVMATGANYAGVYSSPVDLSPNYAVIIIAFCFTISQSGVIFMEYLMFYVLAGQVYGSWRMIFSIASLILLVSAIFFMLRGSGSVQPWNNSGTNEKAGNKKISNTLESLPRTPVSKPRAKSIYNVEKKILKVLHVQEPDKFTRIRAYSTSSPNGKISTGLSQVYNCNNKKRASIS